MKEFPPVPYLTEDQVKQVHKAALTVLSKTGIHLPHAEACRLIKAAEGKGR